MSEDSYSSSTANKAEPYQPCRFFLKGDCNQGQFCRWSHAFPRNPTPSSTHSFPGAVGREIPERAVSHNIGVVHSYALGSPVMPGLSCDSAGAGILFGMGNYKMGGVSGTLDGHHGFETQYVAPPPSATLIDGLERTKELIGAPIRPRGADGKVVRSEDLLQAMLRSGEHDISRNLQSMVGARGSDLNQWMRSPNVYQTSMQLGSGGGSPVRPASRPPGPLPTQSQGYRLGYSSLLNDGQSGQSNSNGLVHRSFTPTAKPFEPQKLAHSVVLTAAPFNPPIPAVGSTSKRSKPFPPTAAQFAAMGSLNAMTSYPAASHPPQHLTYDLTPQHQAPALPDQRTFSFTAAQQRYLAAASRNAFANQGYVPYHSVAPAGYQFLHYPPSSSCNRIPTLPVTLPLAPDDTRPELLNQLRQQVSEVEASIYRDHGIDPALPSIISHSHLPTVPVSAGGSQIYESGSGGKKPEILPSLAGGTKINEGDYEIYIPRPQHLGPNPSTTYPNHQKGVKLPKVRSKRYQPPAEIIIHAPRPQLPRAATLKEIRDLYPNQHEAAAAHIERPSLGPPGLRSERARLLNTNQLVVPASHSPERPGTSHSIRTEVSGLGPLPDEDLEPFPVFEDIPDSESGSHGESYLPSEGYKPTESAPSLHVADRSTDAMLMAGLLRAIEINEGDGSWSGLVGGSGSFSRRIGDDRHIPGRVEDDGAVHGSVRDGKPVPGPVGAASVVVGSVSEDKIGIGSVAGDKVDLDPVGEGRGMAGSVADKKVVIGSASDGKVDLGPVGEDKLAVGSVPADQADGPRVHRRDRSQGVVSIPSGVLCESTLTNPDSRVSSILSFLQRHITEHDEDTYPSTAPEVWAMIAEPGDVHLPHGNIHFENEHNDGTGRDYAATPYRHIRLFPRLTGPSITTTLSLRSLVTPEPARTTIDENLSNIAAAAAILTDYVETGARYIRKPPPPGYEDAASSFFVTGGEKFEGDEEECVLMSVGCECDFNGKYGHHCWCYLYPDA